MTPTLTRRTVLAGSAVVSATALAGPARAAASSSQLAFLNHTYTVLDQVTADAVSANSYLKRFGAFEERTTTNGSQTYTGRYLLGRETYLEMFGPGALPAPDDQVGASGLALGTDRAGTIDTVKQRMVALGSTPLDVVQTKEVDGQQVPWFRVVAPTTSYTAAFPWVMEYLPSFFTARTGHPELPSYPGDVSRERYNADTYAQRMMRDVVAVELGVVAADLPALVVDLKAGGLRVTERAGCAVGVGRAEVIVLRTVARAQAGWRRIGFALNRSQPRRHVERVGRSTLTVGPGPQAVWTFDPR